MCETCRILAARNEELEAELANLRSEARGPRWEAPSEIRLTAQEERLVATLLRHDRVCHTPSLFESTASTVAADFHRDKDTDKDPPSNLVNTLVCKVRRKFAPFGLEIITVWGRGYRITGETRTRLLNWNTTPQATPAAA